MTPKRLHRTYDHRLVQLVQDSGNISIATRLGVPRSTTLPPRIDHVVPA